MFVLPVLLQFLHLYLIANGLNFASWLNVFIQTTLKFIPAFIAGAAAALFYLEGSEKFRFFIGKKIWRYALTTIILVLMYFIIPGEQLGYLNIVSLIFAFLILNLVQSEAGSGKIARIMGRGGKISYGIYIYHSAALIFVSLCFNRISSSFFVAHPLITYITYLIVSFGLLLAMATFSYKYFEKFFFRQKWRFESHLNPSSIITKEYCRTASIKDKNTF
jgi:peptidoglycan/LPS O-acetylase OafA/YrhL